MDESDEEGGGRTTVVTSGNEAFFFKLFHPWVKGLGCPPQRQHFEGATLVGVSPYICLFGLRFISVSNRKFES